jgi:hypothetical protein
MRHLVLALTLVACVPRSAPPPAAPLDELPPANPIVDATDEDARACTRLAELGCPEAERCLGVMSIARTDHIAVPSACLASASDVAAVRRCGDTGTLTFACQLP